MKLLVVGGGGREHAIIKKLKENPEVEKIFALPGNGGIAADAECVPIGAKDIPAMVAFALEQQVDYAVVAPDDPLVLGAVDALNEKGIPCFGPTAAAAQIEGSKVFAKDLMKKYGIPTAAYESFDDAAAALRYLDTADMPIVVKADGLALGKGVIIAQTREEARQAVVSMMEEGMFGQSGSRVVIEEFLTGPEVSVLSFTDGETVVPMVSSMDHKRARDNDQGLNTGGMGTVAPNPYYTEAIAAQCMEEIFLPTIRAMKAEGRPFDKAAAHKANVEKAETLLARVGLGAKLKNYPCELSGGQQQRVAIARALALEPDILCFDEPTSALDPELTNEVLRVIKGLKSADTTMVIVTHEMEFARHVSDHVIFMADGVIEEEGDPEQIFTAPKNEKTRSFLAKSLEQV